MLRACKAIDADPIYELQQFAEHLVCDIWVNADDTNCLDKIDKKFSGLISYEWLRDEIVAIDSDCEGLSPMQRIVISNAFRVNNDIEVLCDGGKPIYLAQLPKVVTEKMKPLFIKFYEELLEKAKVGGDKLEFYKSLYRLNRFKYCICCGYMAFDTGQLSRREAYDHYLPKSEYPFASVNFKNLVPLCYKCNSDHKKAKDPIKNNRKAFYPYRKKPIDITIDIKLGDGFIRSLYENFVNGIDEDSLEPPKIEDITVHLISVEKEQIETWDELFQIKDRFSERTGQFSFTLINKMKRRYNNVRKNDSSWKFVQTLDYHINDYQHDKYTDEKYLKIPFLQALKNTTLASIYS